MKNDKIILFNEMNEYLDTIDNVSNNNADIINFNEFKFKSNIDLLLNNINPSDMKHERILSDYFDTSDVDLIDESKHSYKISTWEGNANAIIYSEDELEIIKNNIKKHLLNVISEQEVKIFNDILSINLDNLINNTKFETKIETILNNDNLLKIISYILNDHDNYSLFKNYYIWFNKSL